jgi:hypothetical protein
MPYTKFITKEFTLGIVAKKFETPINWATFVEETNTNQRSKFFKRLEKMELERKELKALKLMHGKRKLHLANESTTKATKSEIA